MASLLLNLNLKISIPSLAPCSIIWTWRKWGPDLFCSVSLCLSASIFDRMYSFMGGGLFCAGVGNILLIVSTATDYWMQYRHSSNYMHQGLWRYCVPGKCMTHTDSIGKKGRGLHGNLNDLTCYTVFPMGKAAIIFYKPYLHHTQIIAMPQ